MSKLQSGQGRGLVGSGLQYIDWLSPTVSNDILFKSRKIYMGIQIFAGYSRSLHEVCGACAYLGPNGQDSCAGWNFILAYGCPAQLHMDQDTCFEGKVIEEFWWLYQIKKPIQCPTTPRGMVPASTEI